MPKEKRGINSKERRILEIIKNSDGPITASEIQKRIPEYNKNIIQPSLRNLLALNLIEVADTVIERNLVSRKFTMTKEAPKIIGELFFEEYKSLKSLAGSEELFAALITKNKNDKSGKAEISELRKMLEE